VEPTEHIGIPKLSGRFCEFFGSNLPRAFDQVSLYIFTVFKSSFKATSSRMKYEIRSIIYQRNPITPFRKFGALASALPPRGVYRAIVRSRIRGRAERRYGAAAN